MTYGNFVYCSTYAAMFALAVETGTVAWATGDYSAETNGVVNAFNDSLFVTSFKSVRKFTLTGPRSYQFNWEFKFNFSRNHDKVSTFCTHYGHFLAVVGAAVYAIEATTGKQQWNATCGQLGPTECSGITPFDGVVAVYCSSVCVLDAATGKELFAVGTSMSQAANKLSIRDQRATIFNSPGLLSYVLPQGYFRPPLPSVPTLPPPSFSLPPGATSVPIPQSSHSAMPNISAFPRPFGLWVYEALDRNIENSITLDDTIVLFSTDSSVVSRAQRMTAIEPNGGSVLWEVILGGNCSTVFACSATANKSGIAVCSSGAFAFDLRSGKTLWNISFQLTYSTGGNKFKFGNPIIIGDVVVTGFWKTVVGISLSKGELLWTRAENTSAAGSSSVQNMMPVPRIGAVAVVLSTNGIVAYRVSDGVQLWNVSWYTPHYSYYAPLEYIKDATIGFVTSNVSHFTIHKLSALNGEILNQHYVGKVVLYSRLQALVLGSSATYFIDGAHIFAVGDNVLWNYTSNELCERSQFNAMLLLDEPSQSLVAVCSTTVLVLSTNDGSLKYNVTTGHYGLYQFVGAADIDAKRKLFTWTGFQMMWDLSTGKVSWISRPYNHGTFLNFIALHSGVVSSVSASSSGSGVVAVSLNEELTGFAVPASSRSFVVTQDAMIYFLLQHLVAVDLAGKILWHCQLPQSFQDADVVQLEADSIVVISDVGLMEIPVSNCSLAKIIPFAPCTSSSAKYTVDGNTLFINACGQNLWRYTPHSKQTVTPAKGIEYVVDRPFVSESLVLLHSSVGNIYVYNKTDLSPLWHAQMYAETGYDFHFISNGNVVYAILGEHITAFENSTGKMLWRTWVGPTQPQAVIFNNTMYIVTSEGLKCVGLWLASQSNRTELVVPISLTYLYSNIVVSPSYGIVGYQVGENISAYDLVNRKTLWTTHSNSACTLRLVESNAALLYVMCNELTSVRNIFTGDSLLLFLESAVNTLLIQNGQAFNYEVFNSRTGALQSAKIPKDVPFPSAPPPVVTFPPLIVSVPPDYSPPPEHHSQPSPPQQCFEKGPLVAASKWFVQLPSGSYYSDSLLSPDDVILSTSSDVVKLRADDGSIAWTAPLKCTYQPSVASYALRMIPVSPTIGAYLCTGDKVLTIHGFSRNSGSLLWNYTESDGHSSTLVYPKGQGLWEEAFIFPDSMTCFAQWEHVSNYFNFTAVCLNSQTGALKWSFSCPGYQPASPQGRVLRFAKEANLVLLECDGSGIFALRPSDGSIVWNSTMNHTCSTGGCHRLPLGLQEPKVLEYLQGTAFGKHDEVTIFEVSTGTILHHFELPVTQVHWRSAKLFNAKNLTGEQTVVVVGSYSKFLAIDVTTQSVLWEWPPGSDSQYYTPQIQVFEGRIILEDVRNDITYALNPFTGAILWVCNVSSPNAYQQSTLISPGLLLLGGSIPTVVNSTTGEAIVYTGYSYGSQTNVMFASSGCLLFASSGTAAECAIMDVVGFSYATQGGSVLLLVADEERVYVSEMSSLVAYDWATGNISWIRAFNDALLYPVFPPIIVAVPGGMSAVVASDGKSDVIFVDRATGNVLFTVFLPPDDTLVSPTAGTAAFDGAYVFIVASVSCVYRIDVRTSASCRSDPDTCVVKIPSSFGSVVVPPVLALNQLIFYAARGIQAFNKVTLEQQWNISLGYTIDVPTMISYGGIIYVAFRNDVIAIHPSSGTVIWRLMVPSFVYRLVPFNGTLFVMDSHSAYRISLELNPPSRILWEISVDRSGQFPSSDYPPGAMLVSHEGILVISTGFTFGYNASTGRQMWSTMSTSTDYDSSIMHGCTALVAVNQSLVGLCRDGIVGVDVLTRREWARFTSVNGNALYMDSKFVFYATFSRFYAIESRSVPFPFARVAPPVTLPPPTISLPPGFTGVPPYTGMPTLPPDSTEPSLACIFAAEQNLPPLVDCVRQAIAEIVPNISLSMPYKCAPVAKAIETCTSKYLRNMDNNCVVGFSFLSQVLQLVRPSGSGDVCIVQRVCLDGPQAAAALCNATSLSFPTSINFTLPNHWTIPVFFTLTPPPSSSPLPSQFRVTLLPGTALNETVLARRIQTLLGLTFPPQIVISYATDNVIVFHFVGANAQILTEQIFDMNLANATLVDSALGISRLAPEFSQGETKKSNVGVVVGIVIASVVCAVVVFVLLRYSRRRENQMTLDTYTQMEELLIQNEEREEQQPSRVKFDRFVKS